MLNSNPVECWPAFNQRVWRKSVQNSTAITADR